DVTVAFLEGSRLDALNLNDLTHDRDVEELRHSLATERQRDLRPLRTAHLLHGLDETHVLGELALDLEDLITGLDARAERGGVLDRGYDGENPVFDGDLDAEPAEAALRVDLQLAIEVGG